MVHCFGLRRAAFLEFMGFVGDDEVGIVGQQLIFEPPCALVVHHHDLKRLCLGLRQLLLLLGSAPRKDGDFVGEI